MEGNKQFSRKYRKKFRTNFCKKYTQIGDPEYKCNNLEPLELTNTIVKEVAKDIRLPAKL